MEPIVPPLPDNDSARFAYNFAMPYDASDIPFTIDKVKYPFTYDNLMAHISAGHARVANTSTKPADIANYRINMCNRIYQMLNDMISDVKTKAMQFKEDSAVKQLDDADRHSDVEYMNIYNKIDDAANDVVRCIESFRTDWFRDWRDIARFDDVYTYVNKYEEKVKNLNRKDDASNILDVIAEYYGKLSADEETAKRMYSACYGTTDSNPLKFWLAHTVLPQFSALISRLRNVEQAYMKTMQKITGLYDGRVMKAVTDMIAKMNSVHANALQANQNIAKYKAKADKLNEFLTSVADQNEFTLDEINAILSRTPPMSQKEFNGFSIDVKTNLYKACEKVVRNSISVFNTPYNVFSKLHMAITQLNTLVKRMDIAIDVYTKFKTTIASRGFDIAANASNFTVISNMEHEYEQLKIDYDAFVNTNISTPSIFYITSDAKVASQVQALDTLHKEYLGLIFQYDSLYPRLSDMVLQYDLVTNDADNDLTIAIVKSSKVYKHKYSFTSYERVINEITSRYITSGTYTDTVNRMIEYYRNAYSSLLDLASSRVNDDNDDDILAKIIARVEYWKNKLDSREYEANLPYVWSAAKSYLDNMVSLIKNEHTRAKASAIVNEVSEEIRTQHTDRQNDRYNELDKLINLISQFNIATATPRDLLVMEQYCNKVKLEAQKVKDTNMGSDIVSKFDAFVEPKIDEINAFKKQEIDIRGKMENIRMLYARVYDDYKQQTKFTNSSAELESLAAKAHDDLADIERFCNTYINSAVVAERPEMESKYKKITQCINTFKQFDNDVKRYKVTQDIKNYIATEQQKVNNGALDLKSKQVDVEQKRQMGNEAVLDSQAKRNLAESAQAFKQEYDNKEQQQRFTVAENEMAEARSNREFTQSMATRKQTQTEMQQAADIGFRERQATRENEMTQRRFEQEVSMQNSENHRQNLQQQYDQENKERAANDARYVFDENTATTRQVNQFKHEEQGRVLDNAAQQMAYADAANQRQIANARHQVDVNADLTRQKNMNDYTLNSRARDNELVRINQGHELEMFNASTKARAELLQNELAMNKLYYDDVKDSRVDATRNRQMTINDSLERLKLNDARRAADNDRKVKLYGMKQADALSRLKESNALAMNQGNLERGWRKDELDAILNMQRIDNAHAEAVTAQETTRAKQANDYALASTKEANALLMNQANLERSIHKDNIDATLNRQRIDNAHAEAVTAQEITKAKQANDFTLANAKLQNETNQFIENLKMQRAKLEQQNVKINQNPANRKLENEAQHDLERAFEYKNATAYVNNDNEAITLFNDVTEDISRRFNSADLTNPIDGFNAYQNFFNNLTGSIVKNIDLGTHDTPRSVKERLRSSQFKTPLNDKAQNKARSKVLFNLVNNVDESINATLGDNKFINYLKSQYPSFRNATPAEIMTTFMVDRGVNYPSFNSLYKAYKEIGEVYERMNVETETSDNDPYALYASDAEHVPVNLQPVIKPVTTYVPKLAPDPTPDPTSFQYIPTVNVNDMPVTPSKPPETFEDDFTQYLAPIRRVNPFSKRYPSTFGPGSGA